VSVTTGEDGAQERRRQLALLTELREVEHWRRLVAARIDLAVAAVAAVDEPVVRNLPGAPAVPFGLRELLGLAPAGHARGEVDTLLRLRVVQRDLDAYARALRATTRAATQGLLSRLDDPAGQAQPSHAEDPQEEEAPPAPVIILEARRRRRRGPGGPPDGCA
jgi:hypothetical protein